MKAIRYIRYRQLFLLVALILPTLGIAFAGKKILEAERTEIRATLNKAGAAIGGLMSNELGRIMGKQIALSSTGNREYSDSAILLVGSVVQANGQSYPDWTSHLTILQIGKLPRQDSEIVREIAAARTFEQSGDFKRAISHYRTIFQRLDALSASIDIAIQQAATEMSGKLACHVAQLELALGIEAQFSTLDLKVDQWTQFDAGVWLSLTPPTGVAAQPLVIAVRRADIVARVRKEREEENGNRIQFDVIPTPEIKITANIVNGRVQSMEFRDSNGLIILSENLVAEADSIEPVFVEFGKRFPGLGVEVEPDDQTRALLRQHQVFFAILIALYLSVPLVGWYLMLRDTRNETRIADLRSQFVSNVSHELRTPLTSILLFAETLRMRGLTDRKQVAEHLDTIISQSERLTRLLNNVLNFSRIERGQADYHMKLTRLEDVVRSTARSMQFPLAEEGFNLKVDICCDLPPMSVDGDALEQATLNLLTNAMKYSGKSRDITLRMDSVKGNALIQVVDLGIGIAPREQKRIFEKFYRVESLESSAISGVGIGLALVAHIARGHGGSVEVHSDLGKGSTFTINIPIREDRNP